MGCKMNELPACTARQAVIASFARVCMPHPIPAQPGACPPVPCPALPCLVAFVCVASVARASSSSSSCLSLPSGRWDGVGWGWDGFLVPTSHLPPPPTFHRSLGHGSLCLCCCDIFPRSVVAFPGFVSFHPLPHAHTPPHTPRSWSLMCFDSLLSLLVLPTPRSRAKCRVASGGFVLSPLFGVLSRRCCCAGDACGCCIRYHSHRAPPPPPFACSIRFVPL